MARRIEVNRQDPGPLASWGARIIAKEGGPPFFIFVLQEHIVHIE